MSGQASLGSSSHIGISSGGDWQEEVYQKIKSMNEMYYHNLNELYQRMALKFQQECLSALQLEDVPQQLTYEGLEKLRYLVVAMERHIVFMRTNKNEVQIHHKDKIDLYEKQITYLLNCIKGRRLGLQCIKASMIHVNK